MDAEVHGGAGIDVWEIFYQERHKLILSPNKKLDRIFFLDFLPFFFVKLIKIAFFSLSSSKIDFSDNNRIKNR